MIVSTVLHSLEWPLICLYDTVCEHNVTLEHLDDLPGEIYNLTEQCQISVDPTASPDNCVRILFALQAKCHLFLCAKCKQVDSSEFDLANQEIYVYIE